MPKKGEMGVGTLIVFIAMLLVAAVAAGVLIQTAGSLQEQSLTTGQQARSQISTNVRAIEVSGANGRDSALDDFSVIYKLSPGSDPIKLKDILYSESTKDTTNSLTYRHGALPVNDVFTGYFTASYYPKEPNQGVFESKIPNAFTNIFSSSQTSEMMMGKVVVAIIFLESNGANDTNFENWTSAEEDDVMNATRDAINWWNAVEPRANLKVAIVPYTNVPTGYEAITRDASVINQSYYINQSLDYIGAEANADFFTRIRNFNDQLRDQYNAHWAFTFFAVDNSHTGTGFPHGAAGWAYINGPHTVIANYGFGSNPPAALFAHEFGHIFGARDQYRSSGCGCTNSTGGYYNLQSQNCNVVGCLANESSIMRGGQDTLDAYNTDSVDIFALSQLGLVDADVNNLLDPVDLLFGDSTNESDMSQNVINGLHGDYYNPTQNRVVGFFSNRYLQEGTNHRDGNLQRGDVIKVQYESARSIVEDEEIRLTLIPKTGSSTLTKFITPDVVALERVYLYP